ncbi:MAG: HAD-IIIA family hydrolase [Deltaproteobacteria bacterium]|nr:MAG: HAD-IIIA family hydrolase [Deltaproteobacteria bacterium]
MIFRVNVRVKKPERVVFLDRDGTIIRDDGYLSDAGKIEVFEGAREALRKMREKGCALFLVSNQAGVAKGIIPVRAFHEVRREFERVIDPEGEIFDGFFYCLHHPEGKIPSLSFSCPCRKPGTAMVETALSFIESPPPAEKMYVVGDKYSDVLLGKRSGIKSVLVLTGYGSREKEIIDDPLGLPDFIAVDVSEAAEIILERD